MIMTWLDNATVKTAADKASEAQAQAIAEFKASRAEAVKSLTVTTSSGRVFDGNEDSQNRMARAIVALDDGESTDWKMASNVRESVTKEELQEALRLAGSAQTNLWFE